MKLLIEMAGTKVFVTAKQLETIVNTISGNQTLENRYVSAKNGNPACYIDLLRPLNTKDMVRVSVITDEEYDALKFITEQHEANQ